MLPYFKKKLIPKNDETKHQVIKKRTWVFQNTVPFRTIFEFRC